MAVWLDADLRPAPRDWLAIIADQPVLMISDFAEFTADGGVVGAYRVAQDCGFEMNLEALRRSALSISAFALPLSQKSRATIGQKRRDE